ncbi:MAG TPA: hypothetical protein VFP49_11475 [Nitrososphaeraceae archaeon]|nr:hypothetical protein [Nitrososphaeraceae archaeon]
MISFILNLKINKNLIFVFLIGSLIRIIPEIIAYPYPIGYDTINFYIPLVSEVEFDSLKDQFNIFPYLLYILKISTSLDPHNLMIALSSTLYGFFSLSIYLLLQGLAIKPAWFMTIFILFQLSTLRTTWDLQKDILALSFTFLIFYLILKDRKTYFYKKNMIHFCLIISLVIINIFTDTMISFLLIISLSIYFSIKKDRKYIIFLMIMMIIIISFLVLIDDINKNPFSKNINKIFKGNIKENLNYTPLNLGILFIMMNILLFPFFIYGIKNLHELLLYIPLSLALVGSFTWLVLPYSSILLPDRWIITSGIFISIFSSYGLVRLFSSKSKNIPNYNILLPILSIYIVIGLFYMILPNDYAFPIYGIFSYYTQKFVPTTMQFNSIDIADNKDLSIAIDWLNNNTNSKSIIYGDPHLRGWMKTLLKDQRTFKYNYTNFSKNGIYIILADNINLVNHPIKLLFSQGAFKIIEK